MDITYILISFGQHVDTLLHHVARLVLAHVLQGCLLQIRFEGWRDAEATRQSVNRGWRRSEGHASSQEDEEGDGGDDDSLDEEDVGGE